LLFPCPRAYWQAYIRDWSMEHAMHRIDRGGGGLGNYDRRDMIERFADIMVWTRRC